MFQFDMLQGPPTWVAPTEYPELEGLTGFDVETRDPDLMTLGPGWFPGGSGEVVGASCAGEWGQAYWPLRHYGGGNIEDENQFWNWFKNQVAKPSVQIVCHHAGYDVGWARSNGVRFYNEPIDSWIAAVLLDSNRKSYSLNSLSYNILGENKSEEWLDVCAKNLGILRKNIKGNIWRMPAPYVGPYAEKDSVLCRNLMLNMKPQLAEKNLLDAFKRETTICQMLVEMRERGVRVDVDRAEQDRDRCRLLEREALERIRIINDGKPVDVWSGQSLAKAFSAQNLAYPRTDKGQPSFTKEWLRKHDHQLAKTVAEARRVGMIHSKFLSGYILSFVRNGRVFPTVNQLRDEDGGAVTGRFSYESPPLQQMPSPRDDFDGSSKAARSCFLAEENEEWCSADYSSQEPRLMVHFGAMLEQNKVGCRGAMEIAQRFHDDPKTDLHTITADICKIDRGPAKTINLGKAYGMGDASLCHRLGLPTVVEEMTKRRRNQDDGSWEDYTKMVEIAGPEGAEIIRKWNEAQPFLADLAQICSSRARNNGYLRTLGGRHIHFPQVMNKWGKIETWYTNKALNWLIQPSAADQTKQAMVDIWRDNKTLPLMQVHDELCYSIPNRREAVAAIQMGMKHAFELLVPVLTTVKIGRSWGEVVELKEAA